MANWFADLMRRRSVLSWTIAVQISPPFRSIKERTRFVIPSCDEGVRALKQGWSDGQLDLRTRRWTTQDFEQPADSRARSACPLNPSAGMPFFEHLRIDSTPLSRIRTYSSLSEYSSSNSMRFAPE